MIVDGFGRRLLAKAERGVLLGGLTSRANAVATVIKACRFLFVLEHFIVLGGFSTTILTIILIKNSSGPSITVSDQVGISMRLIWRIRTFSHLGLDIILRVIFLRPKCLRAGLVLQFRLLFVYNGLKFLPGRDDLIS